MANIPEGYGLIAGRSRANAQAALDAAKAAGVDPQEVAAVKEGYVVPLAVIDAYHGAGDVQQSAPPVPTDEWKNAEIREWADAHDVDLGDATKKADMLAAIDAAGSA
jgi:hypothetical protein